MTTAETIATTQEFIMPTYGRLPVAFVKGQGARLWDAEGSEYLDFVAGIAVVSVGHSHPAITAAICHQAGELMHTSNLYHIPQQAALARRLSELSFGGKAFFCNSGSEANETAVKLARKWASIHRPDVAPDERTILTARSSFHGRSVTTVTATGQEKYQHGFEPLARGFDYFEFGNADDLASRMGDNVVAVLIEPIQGEGGMNVPPDGFLAQVRALCDAHRCLMILDEVQTGFARTGYWFGYMHEPVTPDIMALAKALGNGFPIGCCLAQPAVADCFVPGNHATTFGGSHLACAAALATLDVIESEGLVARATAAGELLADLLGPGAHPHIAEMRGRGLLRAVRLHSAAGEARAIQDKCRQRGLIVNAMGADRLRLAPPLNITDDELRQAAQIVLAALDA